MPTYVVACLRVFWSLKPALRASQVRREVADVAQLELGAGAHVAESARAHSYFLSKQVQKTC